MTHATRHLDSAIAILKGTAGAKRAPRKGTEISVYLEDPCGAYTIAVNGKVLAMGAGGRDAATKDAEARAARLQALTGKPVTIAIHE